MTARVQEIPEAAEQAAGNHDLADPKRNEMPAQCFEAEHEADEGDGGQQQAAQIERASRRLAYVLDEHA